MKPMSELGATSISSWSESAAGQWAREEQLSTNCAPLERSRVVDAYTKYMWNLF
jgi:hypothetical protein